MKKILSVVFLTFLFFSLNVGHVYSWHFTIVILFDPSDCQGSGISGVTYSDDDTRYYCTYSVDTINNTARIDEVRHAPGTYQYPMDYLHNCKINPTVTHNGKTFVVDEIGKNAFYKVRTFDFNTIELPNTLKKIGDYAFRGMNIKRLIIPSSVEELLERPFHQANIDYLYVPNSIKISQEYPFSECKGNLIVDCENLCIENLYGRFLTLNHFTTITLTSERECYVPANLFNDYSDMHYFQQMDSISMSEAGYDYGVPILDVISKCKGKYSAKIILSDSIIGSKSGFSNSIVDFSNIIFSDNYRIFGGFEGAFLSDRLVIPNSVEIIEENAFSYGSYSNAASKGLQEIIFNDKVHTIKDYAFEGRSLRDLNLPESLRHIGERTFYSCYCDTLIIPDNVEYIGNEAFGWVDNVLIIGKKVSQLGTDFVTGLWNGQIQIIVRNPTPPIFIDGESNNTFSWVYETAELIIPKGSLEAYKKAEVWKNFFNIREEGETSDIIGISNESKDNAPIYNLHGVRMQNTDNLPAGIYIKNGKKYMVR